ncbi:hypothetical protein F5884DRAFT_682850 [Xylogone sp. PMI_703]|nr:hypothetical protein F5884DRAFT_682850 [Xylogone sp. PMI_703]
MLGTAVLRAAAKDAGSEALKKGAKRDPELYVLGGIMAVVFGGAGWYFGRKPTSATSESKVAVADLPWEKEGTTGKYSYHPQANPKNAPREAPSALHSVVVPNVNLPKELHEKYNKWGKEGY